MQSAAMPLSSRAGARELSQKGKKLQGEDPGEAAHQASLPHPPQLPPPQHEPFQALSAPSRDGSLPLRPHELGPEREDSGEAARQSSGENDDHELRQLFASCALAFNAVKYRRSPLLPVPRHGVPFPPPGPLVPSCSDSPPSPREDSQLLLSGAITPTSEEEESPPAKRPAGLRAPAKAWTISRPPGPPPGHPAPPPPAPFCVLSQRSPAGLDLRVPTRKPVGGWGAVQKDSCGTSCSIRERPRSSAPREGRAQLPKCSSPQSKYSNDSVDSFLISSTARSNYSWALSRELSGPLEFDPRIQNIIDRQVRPPEEHEMSPKRSGTDEKPPPKLQRTKAYHNFNFGKDWILSNKSGLHAARLKDFLATEEAWAMLSDEQKVRIKHHLPGNMDYEESGRPSQSFLKYNEGWSTCVREFQEDVQHGRYDRDWLADAEKAYQDRMAGKFDKIKEGEFEAHWGQKQRWSQRAVNQMVKDISLGDLVRGNAIQPDDEWYYSKSYGRGENAFYIKKEIKVRETLKPGLLEVGFAPGRLPHLLDPIDKERNTHMESTSLEIKNSEDTMPRRNDCSLHIDTNMPSIVEKKQKQGSVAVKSKSPVQHHIEKLFGGSIRSSKKRKNKLASPLLFASERKPSGSDDKMSLDSPLSSPLSSPQTVSTPSDAGSFGPASGSRSASFAESRASLQRTNPYSRASTPPFRIGGDPDESPLSGVIAEINAIADGTRSLEGNEASNEEKTQPAHETMSLMSTKRSDAETSVAIDFSTRNKKNLPIQSSTPIILTISDLKELENRIWEEDGREGLDSAYNSRFDAWKAIRVHRNGKEIGSLAELRELYWFRKDRGISQLVGER